MTLNEMKICADETLEYFIQTMPDVPFSKDDIIFDFVKGADMAKRALELCKKYCPEKIINESQQRDLVENIFANVLMGREKSVVIVRINTKVAKRDFKRMMFHELMHIFCGKLEIEGEHFIDIYGCGHTPDENPENVIYDGCINAGYVVWTEFIAQYYAVKLVDKKIFGLMNILETVFYSLSEVTTDTYELSKGSFSMLCSYWLNCTDAKETILKLDEPDFFINSNEKHGDKLKEALYNCLVLLYNKLQEEKPWKISEDFINDLGNKYVFLVTMNSLFHGVAPVAAL